MNNIERAAEAAKVIEGWWIDHYRVDAMQRHLNDGKPYDHDTWGPHVGERAQAKANAEMMVDRLAGLLITDAERAVLDAAEALVQADQYGAVGEYAAANMVLTRAVNARKAAQR